LLHLVGSSILLYLIDDARSNKNQVHILCSAIFGNVSPFFDADITSHATALKAG